MKAIILGMVGIGGIGTAGYYGLGESGPDDFIRTTSKSPASVYNALVAFGPAGDTLISAHAGRRLVQRVTKVPNEQVKLELLIDSTPILSAELQLSPDGTGTRIAAEADVDLDAIHRIADEAGLSDRSLPNFARGEDVIDAMFARAMDEMVDRIEQDKPLTPLADSWAQSSRGGDTPEVVAASRRLEAMHQRLGTRQQLGTRPQHGTHPALDPNAAARRHLSGSRPGSSDD